MKRWPVQGKTEKESAGGAGGQCTVPSALTPNTVELFPTLGSLSPPRRARSVHGAVPTKSNRFLVTRIATKILYHHFKHPIALLPLMLKRLQFSFADEPVPWHQRARFAQGFRFCEGYSRFAQVIQCLPSLNYSHPRSPKPQPPTPKSRTLRPKPQALSPKPQAPNSRSQTQTPKLTTPNSQPQTHNPKLKTPNHHPHQSGCERHPNR